MKQQCYQNPHAVLLHLLICYLTYLVSITVMSYYSQKDLHHSTVHRFDTCLHSGQLKIYSVPCTLHSTALISEALLWSYNGRTSYITLHAHQLRSQYSKNKDQKNSVPPSVALVPDDTETFLHMALLPHHFNTFSIFYLTVPHLVAALDKSVC